MTRLLSRKDVEETYGISKRFLELAVLSGKGPAYVKVGRLVKYTEADIDSWIQANRHGD